MRKVLVLLAAVLLSGLLSGCFWNEQVEANEVGLIMPDGVAVRDVVGAGRYTEWGWFAEIVKVDTSAKTLEWSDPDLWTSDKQPLAFKVGITYARKRDAESVKHMWTMYNAEARDDKALAQQVLNRIPRVAKTVTTQFTLDQMLGIEGGAEAGRAVIQQQMFNLLAKELDEFDVVLLDIGANDIGADENYIVQLKNKAAAKVEAEVAQQRTLQLQEQVKQEQAQTQVAMEIARRDNMVAAEKAKVYQMSKEAYELKRLELLAGIVGDNDKVYFIPQGADLTLFLSGQGGVTPVPVPATE